MNKLKVMTVFGTRPEAIKMAPLVKGIERDKDLESIVCVTAQHREMLDQVLDLFDITPDYDLNIMKSGQTIGEITSRVLLGFDEVLKEVKPDIVLVHGDTTTTFSASLSAFYNQVKVGHVEAGLRSGNKYSPYPEEMNRSLVGKIADLHFSPTVGNKENLLKEGMLEDTIFITGNTVIDALFEVVREDYEFETKKLQEIDFVRENVILLTTHRRENLGRPMEDIFDAVNIITNKYPDIQFVFPVHLNPKVRQLADSKLGKNEAVHMIEPLEYAEFANLIGRVQIIMTDSGGVQEEAPAFGKPVLVLRTETERPEAVDAGTVEIVGVDTNRIVEAVSRLMDDKNHYDEMANAVNPYGDGKAVVRTIEAIKEYFGK